MYISSHLGDSSPHFPTLERHDLVEKLNKGGLGSIVTMVQQYPDDYQDSVFAQVALVSKEAFGTCYDALMLIKDSGRRDVTARSIFLELDQAGRQVEALSILALCRPL